MICFVRHYERPWREAPLDRYPTGDSTERCSRGSGEIEGYSRGGVHAARIGSGCRRCCSNRPGWSRPSLTTFGSSVGFPTSVRSPEPARRRCSRSGRGQDTTHGRGTSGPPPARWSSTTGAASRGDHQRSKPSPGSGPMSLARSPASHSKNVRWRSTRTCSASPLGWFWNAETRDARRFGGTWSQPSRDGFRDNPRASSTRRSWSSDSGSAFPGIPDANSARSRRTAGPVGSFRTLECFRDRSIGRPFPRSRPRSSRSNPVVDGSSNDGHPAVSSGAFGSFPVGKSVAGRRPQMPPDGNFGRRPDRPFARSGRRAFFGTRTRISGSCSTCSGGGPPRDVSRIPPPRCDGSLRPSSNNCRGRRLRFGWWNCSSRRGRRIELPRVEYPIGVEGLLEPPQKVDSGAPVLERKEGNLR
jgi:hypothetical protein